MAWKSKTGAKLWLFLAAGFVLTQPVCVPPSEAWEWEDILCREWKVFFGSCCFPLVFALAPSGGIGRAPKHSTVWCSGQHMHRGRVSADVSAQEAAQTFVQTVAENKDFLVSSAGFGVSVASTFWTYRQVQEAERATAETKRHAAEAERATAEAKRQTAEAKRQAEAFKQSDEYKVQRAVAKFMDPFVPKMPKRKVIHRKVMDTIANRVKTWDEHATIVSGRFQTGKTVAVEEVLRGARGIFKHTVKDEHWEEKLYKSLQVDGPGMFEAVLVRVKAELAKLADPITKTPIILFEVPRTTTKGRGQNLPQLPLKLTKPYPALFAQVWTPFLRQRRIFPRKGAKQRTLGT